MQDAGYFRAQAELYFELARRMSVASDAQYFRGNAERHLASAVELEARPADSDSPEGFPVPERNQGSRRRADVSPFGRT